MKIFWIKWCPHTPLVALLQQQSTPRVSNINRIAGGSVISHLTSTLLGDSETLVVCGLYSWSAR